MLGNVTIHSLYTACFLEPAFKSTVHALLPFPTGKGASASKEREKQVTAATFEGAWGRGGGEGQAAIISGYQVPQDHVR